MKKSYRKSVKRGCDSKKGGYMYSKSTTHSKTKTKKSKTLKHSALLNKSKQHK